MKKSWLLIILTILVLVPGYLIRYKESVYMWFYQKLTTYPGDVWNFFANYLQKGLHYPPEYPAGLRFFYELFGFYKYHDYTWFFSVNAIILMVFACATTYFIFRISQITNHKSQISNILIFWIFAPTFLFFSFFNYDLPVVFLMVLAVYLYYCKKNYWAIAVLALGTVVKVFPIFLLPIFVLKSPKKDWVKLVLLFVGIVIVLNLPYAIGDFQKWVYPYTWQISENISRDPKIGPYWGLFYPIFNNKIGIISIVLYAILYVFTYIKLKKTTLINLSIAVILLFLLTDRIYSPQYNLYLLPFLALADYRIDKKSFYLLEIANVFIVLFLVFLRDNWIFLQILMFTKYLSIIWLYINNFINSKKLHNFSSSNPAKIDKSIN